MPFGEYKNFADCVAKNKSKGNPKAYCATIQRKAEGKELKISNKFGKIDLKELKEEYYSKGYIATTHLDSVGDKIQKETLESWAGDINSTNNSQADNVSIHHDRADINLAGKGETAKVEQLDDGEYGLFVETHHNKTHPDFADTVYQIGNGFLSHYSIEYDTHDESTTRRENTDDGWVRHIEPGTDLVGYGLASPRTVVNENAPIKEAGYKELIHFIKEKSPNTKPNEVKKMEKTKVKEVKEDAPKEPVKEEPKAEEKSKEEAPKEEAKEEPKAEKEMKEFKEFQDFKTRKEEADAKIAKEVKELKEKKNPMLPSKTKIENKEGEETANISYKEAVFGKEGKRSHISVQWKEAAKLHTALDAKGQMNYSLKGVGEGHRPFTVESKEVKIGDLTRRTTQIQYKTLTTDSNYSGAQTTYWDSLDHYEQTPAELNDIYGPVIISQLNEMTTTYNLIPKVDMSGDSAIRFRVKTARPVADGSQSYGSTPGWTKFAERRKINLAFTTYRQDVAVEFEEIELARAAGGIGDVYAEEIKDGTESMMNIINSDILTSATTPAEGEPYTLPTTVITSGSIYGRSLTTYPTLQAASNTAAGSVPLTLERMRKMIDDVKARGAGTDELVFIGHYTQSRKFKTLIQNLQRTVPTSARVGFEGRPELDGVPFFEDYQATTSDLWLISLKHTKFGMKKAPTYVEFGLTEMKRNGIIWQMGNLFCTKPGHNARTSGLKTT